MEPVRETSLRRTPLWRRFFNLSLFAVVALAAYGYRDTLASWVARRPASAAPGTNSNRNSGDSGGRGASTVVSVLPAKKSDMPTYLKGLGSATPYAAVVVRSRVDGQLIKTTFQEGQFVHEG